MPRSPRAPLLGAVLSLLALPPLASAGPISPPPPQPPDIAAYSVTILPADGQTQLYLGRYEEWTQDAVNEWHATTPFPSTLGGGFSAGSEIRLLVTSKQSHTFTSEAPTGPNASDEFRVRVTVTDYGSGQSGAFEFTARAGLITGLPSNSYSEVLLSANATESLTLGRNEYSFHIEDGDTDSGAWVYANVNVTPTASSPEPGTLALAGIGLGLIGRRLRRR